MKINLNLDYNVRQPINQKQNFVIPDSRELTDYYINTAVSSKYPDGLGGQMGRIWGRLQRKLEDAVYDKQDEIDVEQAELDFIKKTIEGGRFPVSISKYVLVLEDYITSLKYE